MRLGAARNGVMGLGCLRVPLKHLSQPELHSGIAGENTTNPAPSSSV